MPTQELKAIITAELKGNGFKEAVDELQAVQKASNEASNEVVQGLDKMENAVKQASGAFVKIQGSFQDVTKAEQAFISAARQGNLAWGTTATAAARAAARAGKAVQQSGRMFVNAKGGIVNADQALTNLGRVASDLPFGFIAIQNNLDPLIQSFGSIFSRSKNAAEGFKAIGAALGGAGGIGLAFSILTSAVTSLIQKYGDLGTAIIALTGGLSAGEKAQNEYNQAIAEGVGSAEGEIAGIKGLLSVAQDETISRDQRTKAIQQLQKEYPGYLKNLTLENINSIEATNAINLLTDALRRKAKIQAAQDLIGKESQKILEAQTKGVIQQASFWNVLSSTILNAGNVAATASDLAAAGIKNQAKTIAEAEGTIDNFQRILNDLLKEDALQEVIGIGDKGKELKTVSDILEALELELTGIDVKAQAVGATFTDLGGDKINAFKKALDELVKIGIKPGALLFTDIQKRVEDVQQFLKTGAGITEPVTVPIIAAPVFQIPRGAGTVIRGLGDEFKPILDDLTKQLNRIVESSVEGAIVSLAESFGQALITGDFSSIFKAFAGTIGNFLSEMGKALIATGVGLEAFKKSLASFQGIGAIVAGAALVVAGAAFKAIVGGGVSSFATGGAVFRPTLATIGDNPGREEHIIPSEVLDKLGGGNVQGVLTARIAGNDLLILLQRAEKENNR